MAATPAGTWWKSAGSASPGRTRTSAAGRSPRVARPSGPSSVSEFERLGAGEDRDRRPGLEGTRLQVREQAGVLLGFLGDAIDGRTRAGLDLGQADALRPSLRDRGIDRVPVRARLRVAEQLVEAGLDPGRDRALQAHGLLVRLRPAEADDARQQPLQERVAAKDRVRGSAAGRGQPELAVVGVVDESVRHEPAEHLAGRLGGYAEVARDLRGGRAGPVPGAGGHAKGEQVLLGRGGQVGLVMSTGHDLRIRDRRGPRPLVGGGGGARSRGVHGRPRIRARPPTR